MFFTFNFFFLLKWWWLTQPLSALAQNIAYYYLKKIK